jgi:hypothetical protein
MLGGSCLPKTTKVTIASLSGQATKTSRRSNCARTTMVIFVSELVRRRPIRLRTAGRSANCPKSRVALRTGPAHAHFVDAALGHQILHPCVRRRRPISGFRPRLLREPSSVRIKRILREWRPMAVQPVRRFDFRLRPAFGKRKWAVSAGYSQLSEREARALRFAFAYERTRRNLVELPCNFNYVRVRSFILSGAPLSTHLRTRNGPIRASQDRSFEYVFATFDADLGIIELNHVDQGLQTGLAERNRSGGKVLTHAAAKLLKRRGIDLDGLR